TALPLASCIRTSSCSWRRQNAWGVSSKAAKSFSISGKRRWISSVRTQTSRELLPLWRNRLASRCVARKPDMHLADCGCGGLREFSRMSIPGRRHRECCQHHANPALQQRRKADGDHKEWLKTDTARTGKLV